ncbi:MAG: HAMP domain-containing histidine kinase [Bdellovibrionales bacterium]|nr:HAMP domain-containing histidine kinase [Bdellovibrionales bacterium]
MRSRFFFTIFGVLILTVVASSVVHFSFFRAERLRLVDQQIQSIASSLVSNLSVVEFEDIEETEEVISETLGSERIRMLIYIRGAKGESIYLNRNAQILDYLPPLSPQRETYRVNGHMIRVLNLPLKDMNWILQVGLVLDQGQVHWRTVSYSVIFYIALILVVMLVGSYFLTVSLLRPLRSLASYLKYVAESPTDAAALAQAPGASLFSSGPSRGRIGRRMARYDEFSQLVVAIQQLNQKINARFLLMHSWTAQMAHELKTPLTIIRNSIESVQVKLGHADADLVEAQQEIDHLGRVISSFLEWVRLEKLPGNPEDLHALHLANVARDVARKLNKLNHDRIALRVEGNALVFAKPDLLTQLFTNLLQNALQYSPQNSPVELVVEDRKITVQDRGAGIPPRVLEKIGEPFNWGAETHLSPSGSTLVARGSGLGLAWIKSICTRYGWTLDLDSTAKGTRITVTCYESPN